jgi:UDP-N-acetylglucosamine 2-epimerase (non-hydrolysing)
MKTALVVVGTRPEIIKMAPLIRALKEEETPFSFVHCGQHYDYNMSQQFIENLELPSPDRSFKIRSSSPAEQTARILAHMSKLLKETRPGIVLVEGDTNTVLAAAIAANKSGIPVGHIEAGLRSNDLRMPEEHNRRMTDHISSVLFAPTAKSEDNLVRENVWGKIFVTGNTVIDAVVQHLPMAEKKSDILKKIRFDSFALATAHRAENVDDLKVLTSLMEVFADSPIPVVFSIHPRTKKRLRQHAIYSKTEKNKNIQVFPPLGYLDFLVLMKRCKFIITDSGGIQEEATAPAIRKPVLVTRLSTERPEAVEAGFAEVVGTGKGNALLAVRRLVKEPKELPSISPFGDGTAAKKIAKVVREEFLE